MKLFKFFLLIFTLSSCEIGSNWPYGILFLKKVASIDKVNIENGKTKSFHFEKGEFYGSVSAVYNDEKKDFFVENLYFWNTTESGETFYDEQTALTCTTFLENYLFIHKEKMYEKFPPGTKAALNHMPYTVDFFLNYDDEHVCVVNYGLSNNYLLLNSAYIADKGYENFIKDEFLHLRR